MIDLIREEIFRNFTDKLPAAEAYYNIHCSPAFASSLQKELESFRDSSSFVVDVESKPSEFFLPGIGHLNILKDMLQGYRIEKVGTSQAALPPYLTVIKEFPHMSNTYCMDKQLAKKDDILTSGREKYLILTDPMPYVENALAQNLFVYTLDQPLQPPIVGKRLTIEYIKNIV